MHYNKSILQIRLTETQTTFSLYSFLLFNSEIMDDDPKKQAKRKKLEEHRKWLEEMKVKQSSISASHTCQIPERKRKSVFKKTAQELRPRIDFAMLYDNFRITE